MKTRTKKILLREKEQIKINDVLGVDNQLSVKSYGCKRFECSEDLVLWANTNKVKIVAVTYKESGYYEPYVLFFERIEHI
jgi:hypothetical protein